MLAENLRKLVDLKKQLNTVVKAISGEEGGGTISLADLPNKLSTTVTTVIEDNTEYSAFEVMPNKEEITAGTVDEVTGLTYTRAVPACTVHKMTLRSSQEPEDCDVIIDWGDGTVQAIKEGHYTAHTAGKSYEVEHDYAPSMSVAAQRFVVKIRGKNYYTFRHNSYKDNNLISRIFDNDLPIASHIVNLASMAYSADRLLKVHFPSYTAPYSNVWNWSSCFEQCPNVVSITGFEDISISDGAALSALMASCGALTTTDFVFPAGMSRIQNVFTGNTKLARDINDFFPKQGFSSANIMIRAPFNYCRSVTGIVPADKLWNNPDITWSFEHANDLPFKNCSNELRAQVPVSWGGTNKAIEAELQVKKLAKQLGFDLNYYSAFEVMPNKAVIPVGTVDDVTGLTYNRAVPACTVHKMTLRSAQEPADCDVVIDWGDGTVQAIKDITWTTATHTAGKSYELSHDYASAMPQSSQRFVVKIYGKDYYTFRHNSYKDNNLISRIFDAEFPMASHVLNFASMVCSADRLLKVHFPHSTVPFSDVWNWSSCFNECPNVVSITGFEDMMPRGDAEYSGFMAACANLVTTDFVFPASMSKIPNMFSGDINLERDINAFFPKQGFSSSNILIRAPFNACKKLTGTVPADKLWNDPHITWKWEHATDRPFSNCLANIKEQVPVSWGGTLEETTEE